ncbi:MAG: permease-like cell division protein FtsX, partial [Acidimicrobiia bacterium]
MACLTVSGACSGGSSTHAKSDQPDLVVVMAPTATATQIATVRHIIGRSHDVARFSFESQAAAYREFKRIERDSPDLIAITRPSDLSASFSVHLTRSRSTLAHRLDRLPGVEVETRRPSRGKRRYCQQLRRSLAH